jgi:hypothetical protein
MSGKELADHRIAFDCDVVNDFNPDLPDAMIVTVNPFVPSFYAADSFSTKGAFPTMTLAHLLGEEGFMQFESERHEAIGTVAHVWPDTRILFLYYLQGNWPMFTKIARSKLGLDWDPVTAHQRTSVAYQALAVATTPIVGSTGTHTTTISGRFARKHTAAMRYRPHLQAFRARGAVAAQLERDVFTEINRFVDHHESWEMGLLVSFAGTAATAELESLVLYRDEFSVVRDLYQQGFELACKCIWPLVAAQNSVKRGDPDLFGEDHPASVPLKQRPDSLSQFDKLANAHKVAYAAQVPGWDSLAVLLNNRRRNTIGHATAHHDLQTGRIVSDKDAAGITYINFLGMTRGVFEALCVLAQVLRSARVASSPNFFPEAE